MVWEENIDSKFAKHIIPKSFTSHQFPFIQFRLPQSPDDPNMLLESGQNPNKQKHPPNLNHFPTKNIEYFKVKPSTYSLTPTSTLVEGYPKQTAVPNWDNIKYPLGEIIYQNVSFDKANLDGINKN